MTGLQAPLRAVLGLAGQAPAGLQGRPLPQRTDWQGDRPCGFLLLTNKRYHPHPPPLLLPYQLLLSLPCPRLSSHPSSQQPKYHVCQLCQQTTPPSPSICRNMPGINIAPPNERSRPLCPLLPPPSRLTFYPAICFDPKCLASASLIRAISPFILVARLAARPAPLCRRPQGMQRAAQFSASVTAESCNAVLHWAGRVGACRVRLCSVTAAGSGAGRRSAPNSPAN